MSGTGFDDQSLINKAKALLYGTENSAKRKPLGVTVSVVSIEVEVH